MKAPTKRALNAKMIMYRKKASDRLKDAKAIDSYNRTLKLKNKGLEQEIKELYKYLTGAQNEIFELTKATNPWQSQHGGKHYAELTIQPLQFTLGAMGYEAFKGACHNHVARYTTRKKDNEVEQLKKAKHILEIWIYEAEKRNNLKGK